MSEAVCLKCGTLKHGPWVRCHRCGHLPADVVDKAKHEMTSTHCLSQADLKTIAAQIQSGHPRHFDPRQLERFVTALRTTRLDSRTKEQLVANVVRWAVILGAGGGVFWFFHWLTR